MEFSNRERYLLWLGFVTNCEYSRYTSLLQAYDGDPQRIFQEAKESGFAEGVKLKQEKKDSIHAKANEAYIDRCLEFLQKNRIGVATRESADYPRLLTEIYDPPLLLFFKGRLQRASKLPIAVIGSRKCTEYGKRAAGDLARELSLQGVTVVSGLAYGIDAMANRCALDAKGNDYPTVAVLGNGVERPYPASNRALYDSIVERGAVISEFLPGMKPRKENFPRRNRIISGLSRGVLVVEAGEKSGTSITVDCALEQGRDVFAVPGRITDMKSMGTNSLIACGTARMVLSVADVLEEYGLRGKARPAPALPDYEKLTLEQSIVCRLLEAGERSFDELAALTSLSPAALNCALTEMEFSGIIKQSPGRLFSL